MRDEPAAMPMVDRWLAALPATAAPSLGAAAGGDLLRRWREPHRRYHTVEHLSAVLSTWLQRNGTIDNRRWDILAACEQDLLRVIPELDGCEAAYYQRLLNMTILVLNAWDDASFM